MFDFFDHIEPCEQLAMKNAIAVFNGVNDKQIDELAGISNIERFSFFNIFKGI